MVQPDQAPEIIHVTDEELRAGIASAFARYPRLRDWREVCCTSPWCGEYDYLTYDERHALVSVQTARFLLGEDR